MSTFELNQKTRELLDRVRHQPKFLSVFEMPSDLAEAALRASALMTSPSPRR